MTDQGPKPPPEEPISIPPEPTPGQESEPDVISLVEEGTATEARNLRAFGSRLGVEKKSEFKRELNVTGHGATRCRVFHSRIAQAPLAYMEKQINDWLDSENAEVKHVGHVTGIMEGKTPEPNVIVMVWY